MLRATATMYLEARPLGGTVADDATAAFVQVRQRLLQVAHRVLGDWTEAEDVVQDAWLRWQGCNRDEVHNPTAFLVTTATRLAINAATSARARRETAASPWLPDLVDASDDPSTAPERRQSVELGMLLLLERLTPVERAAYLLRQAFDYPYARIAGLLDISEANARQLVSRAGGHLSQARLQPVDPDVQQHLVRTFELAARRGQVGPLEDLLASDAGVPAPLNVAA